MRTRPVARRPPTWRRSTRRCRSRSRRKIGCSTKMSTRSTRLSAARPKSPRPPQAGVLFPQRKRQALVTEEALFQVSIEDLWSPHGSPWRNRATRTKGKNPDVPAVLWLGVPKLAKEGVRQAGRRSLLTGLGTRQTRYRSCCLRPHSNRLAVPDELCGMGRDVEGADARGSATCGSSKCRPIG